MANGFRAPQIIGGGQIQQVQPSQFANNFFRQKEIEQDQEMIDLKRKEMDVNAALRAQELGLTKEQIAQAGRLGVLEHIDKFFKSYKDSEGNFHYELGINPETNEPWTWDGMLNSLNDLDDATSSSSVPGTSSYDVDPNSSISDAFQKGDDGLLGIAGGLIKDAGAAVKSTWNKIFNPEDKPGAASGSLNTGDAQTSGSGTDMIYAPNDPNANEHGYIVDPNQSTKGTTSTVKRSPYTPIDIVEPDKIYVGVGAPGADSAGFAPNPNSNAARQDTIDYTKDLLNKYSTNQTGGMIDYDEGGFLPGKRTGDKNPALLEDGEYVLNRNAVEKIGKGYLDYINNERYPRFQSGGFYGGMYGSQGGEIIQPIVVERDSKGWGKKKDDDENEEESLDQDTNTPGGDIDIGTIDLGSSISQGGGGNANASSPTGTSPAGFFSGNMQQNLLDYANDQLFAQQGGYIPRMAAGGVLDSEYLTDDTSRPHGADSIGIYPTDPRTYAEEMVNRQNIVTGKLNADKLGREIELDELLKSHDRWQKKRENTWNQSWLELMEWSPLWLDDIYLAGAKWLGYAPDDTKSISDIYAAKTRQRKALAEQEAASDIKKMTHKAMEENPNVFYGAPGSGPGTPAGDYWRESAGMPTANPYADLSSDALLSQFRRMMSEEMSQNNMEDFMNEIQQRRENR
tara:strand:+ start:353 stop:2395 length:2043 start_codon:yes stop_codon:yes gene_type:complete